MKTINRRKAIKEICAWTGLIFVPKYLAHADPDAEAAILSQVPASGGSTVITSGLLSRWNFLEGTGSSSADTSGNGNSVALTGSPTWGTGPGGVTGGSLTFDGETQFGTAPNFADNLADFTLSCWFQLVNFINADQPMIAKLDTGGMGNGTGYVLGAEVTNTVVYATNLAVKSAYTGWDPDATAKAGDSIWHHHCGIFTNTGTQVTIAYYLDNVLITFSQDKIGTLHGGFLSNAKNVYLASDFTGELFEGSLADCRIYNRLLSSTEVGQIFAKTG